MNQKIKHHKHQDEQRSNGEHNPDPNRIEHRACELYLDRGSDPGHDFDDWLRAEPESKAPGEAEPGNVLQRIWSSAMDGGVHGVNQLLPDNPVLCPGTSFLQRCGI